nr:hypothetical protein Iba_chr02bCG18840 [Ipomoea batatas]
MLCQRDWFVVSIQYGSTIFGRFDMQLKLMKGFSGHGNATFQRFQDSASIQCIFVRGRGRGTAQENLVDGGVTFRHESARNQESIGVPFAKGDAPEEVMAVFVGSEWHGQPRGRKCKDSSWGARSCHLPKHRTSLWTLVDYKNGASSCVFNNNEAMQPNTLDADAKLLNSKMYKRGI